MLDDWRKSPNWVFRNQNTFLYSTYFGFIAAKAIRENYPQEEERASLSDSVIRFLNSKSTSKEWKSMRETMTREDFKRTEAFFRNDKVRNSISLQITEEWMNAIWDFDYFMEFILEEITKLQLELIFDDTKWLIEGNL